MIELKVDADGTAHLTMNLNILKATVCQAQAGYIWSYNKTNISLVPNLTKPRIETIEANNRLLQLVLKAEPCTERCIEE